MWAKPGPFTYIYAVPTGTQHTHTHKLSLGLALEAPTTLRMRNFLIIANFRPQLFTSRKILRLPLEKLPIYEYAVYTRTQFTPTTVAHAAYTQCVAGEARFSQANSF